MAKWTEGGFQADNGNWRSGTWVRRVMWLDSCCISKYFSDICEGTRSKETRQEPMKCSSTCFLTRLMISVRSAWYYLQSTLIWGGSWSTLSGVSNSSTPTGQMGGAGLVCRATPHLDPVHVLEQPEWAPGMAWFSSSHSRAMQWLLQLALHAACRTHWSMESIEARWCNSTGPLFETPVLYQSNNKLCKILLLWGWTYENYWSNILQMLLPYNKQTPPPACCPSRHYYRTWSLNSWALACIE